MTQFQNPNIPMPTQALEIDKAIYQTQLRLDAELSWLTHDYGRAFRFMEYKEKRLYFPEVYLGGPNHDYYRVTPDNDHQGTVFFVAERGRVLDFQPNQYNHMAWNVGIVFWVNLQLIDPALIQVEDFTQRLINEARGVLTRKLSGLGFRFNLFDEVRSFDEVFKGFTLDPDNKYLRKPYSGFRFNGEIVLREHCDGIVLNFNSAFKEAFRVKDVAPLILPDIDFTDPTCLALLTEQQKTDLLAFLNP